MPHNQLRKDKFKQLKCCVLLPTYNNATTLAGVIEDVFRYTDDILVVNDGSTDSTNEVLSNFPSVKVLAYSPNRGKGNALRKGFEFARSNGYEYVITMDTDGQHFADDLPIMIDALEKNNNAIVIGARNMNQSSVPGKSSFGNKFSNFWFTLETGISLPDTQSGYRLYPVKKLEGIRFFTRKYEFEIEVIVRGAWSGLDVIAVPVKVYYPPADERISHFRPFKDFSRISVLNTVLVFWTFAWIKPRDFVRSFKKKNLSEILDEYLIRSHETPATKAWSVALGVFFGITPFWGFQIWFVLAFAWMFNLNKALAVLASNISIPPMIPPIVFLSFQAGKIWMGGKSVQLNYDSRLSLEGVQQNFLQYVMGSFTLAVIVALLLGLATFIFVSATKRDRAIIES
jgi:glycosyltransferase involved in cell wall biosynthesis